MHLRLLAAGRRPTKRAQGISSVPMLFRKERVQGLGRVFPIRFKPLRTLGKTSRTLQRLIMLMKNLSTFRNDESNDFINRLDCLSL